MSKLCKRCQSAYTERETVCRYDGSVLSEAKPHHAVEVTLDLKRERKQANAAESKQVDASGLASNF